MAGLKMVDAPGTVDARMHRVLVVEDEDNIALALQYVVEREGHRCFRISDGAEAEQAIREMRPDLILLDVMLPQVSGYDICQSVRADPDLAGVKILMMTARGSANEQKKVLALGADGFVSKPFELKYLRTEVHRVLGA